MPAGDALGGSARCRANRGVGWVREGTEWGRSQSLLERWSSLTHFPISLIEMRRAAMTNEKTGYR
jgi:hypothetical protein